MITIIPILQMRESRLRVVKNCLGISSGGRIRVKSASFWLQILFLVIVHLSHVDMSLVISSNHMALIIYMMSESQIYISNVALALSSRFG